MWSYALSPPLIITLLFLGACGWIAWRWWQRRKDRAARVAYVTVHGVTVLRSGSGRVPPKTLVEASIERAYNTVRDWARDSGTAPTPVRTLVQALNGARLGFVDTPKVWFKGVEQDARGQTLGRAMEVSIAWPEDIVLSLVSHEAAHLLMSALGVPEGRDGEIHHKIAAAAGFNV